MMNRQKIARVLRQAAAVVQERGLARGRRMDREGQVCALGALDVVLGVSGFVERALGYPVEDHQQAVAAVVERLWLRLGDHQDPYNPPPKFSPFSHDDCDYFLARWSNLSAGKEEVVDGFLRVAEMLEGELETAVVQTGTGTGTGTVRTVQYSTVPPVPPVPPLILIHTPEVEVEEERELVGV